MGKIGALLSDAKRVRAPVEKRLRRLGRRVERLCFPLRRRTVGKRLHVARNALRIDAHDRRDLIFLQTAEERIQCRFQSLRRRAFELRKARVVHLRQRQYLPRRAGRDALQRTHELFFPIAVGQRIDQFAEIPFVHRERVALDRARRRGVFRRGQDGTHAAFFGIDTLDRVDDRAVLVDQNDVGMLPHHLDGDRPDRLVAQFVVRTEIKIQHAVEPELAHAKELSA